MLQHKGIKNLSELKESFVKNRKNPEFFLSFMNILKLSKLHGTFSNAKQKGISSIQLIRLLLIFPFIEQASVFSFTMSYWQEFAGYGKDAYYRLKNNAKINWRVFLFGVVKLMIKTIESRNLGNENKSRDTKAFIFDDTLLPKTGKAIEGVSKIWDHAIQASVLGFQLLTMGYYDGTMFLPINFSLHRSKGKNKKQRFGLKPKDYRKQYKKTRTIHTAGYKRKKELDSTKIESAVKMIKAAVKQNIKAQYVLADSWFTCWALVKTTIENGMTYIGMFSKVKTLFTYRNKKLTYKKIRHLNRKKTKRNKRFKIYYIRTVVEWNGQHVVLLFTRKGKKGNWKSVISTDLSLSATEIIEVYQIRWTIEVFFKESKQSLGLGKSQSNDFDAQIADTTMTMIQYLFLALQNRIDNYESLGQLFNGTKEKMVKLRLHERLIALLTAIIDIMVNLFDVESDEEIIMERAINNDEALTKLLKIMDIHDET